MAGDRFDAEAAVLDTYGDAARRDLDRCCRVSLEADPICKPGRGCC
jgi:hypothetical protein